MDPDSKAVIDEAPNKENAVRPIRKHDVFEKPRFGVLTDRSFLKNYTHLPQISRKELTKELKSLKWSDKLPSDLPPEEDEDKRRELQNEFFMFCHNYLWSDHNNKEGKSDGYYRFFGAAWQDYFSFYSKSTVGRGGTYIRWRAEKVAENEQSTVSINEIDNLRKIMYPQPKKKAMKRSYASLEQSSDDESDDESDTKMTQEDTFSYLEPRYGLSGAVCTKTNAR
eukprot:scaffold4231_cov74-Skeletonema_menzelii.AAC.1